MVYKPSEYHACRPDIHTVIVPHTSEQQLRCLIVDAGHLTRVILVGEVEVSESEVHNLQSSFGVVDEYVMRFDIPVHDSLGVDVIEGLQLPSYLLKKALACSA